MDIYGYIWIYSTISEINVVCCVLCFSDEGPSLETLDFAFISAVHKRFRFRLIYYIIICLQGLADNFYTAEQLLPENFKKVCGDVQHPLNLRMQEVCAFIYFLFFLLYFISFHFISFYFILFHIITFYSSLFILPTPRPFFILKLVGQK